MADYFVFDKHTGKIIRFGTCSDDMVAQQAIEANEMVGSGAVLPDDKYEIDITDNFSIVNKSDKVKVKDSTSVVTQVEVEDVVIPEPDPGQEEKKEPINVIIIEKVTKKEIAIDPIVEDK
jgi:hypothetical protein